MRRPAVVLALIVVLALAGGGFALARLAPSTGTGSLVGSGSSAAQATAVAHARFGDDAIYVLVRGDLARMVLTADLNKLVGLEGCLSGNVPRGATPPGGWGSPCGRLARARSVQVVYGPGTFVNSAVAQITLQLQGQTKARAAQADRAATAARKLALARGDSAATARKLGDEAAKLVYAQFARDLLNLDTRYGLNLTGAPQINDPDFVYQLVFDPARGARTPKARFAYLFPSPSSALISVRPKPGLSDAARARTIALVRDVVAMPRWHLSGHAQYVVTGVPVLADALAGTLAAALLRLLAVAAIVMALVLALLFRARLRLLPLLIALASLGILLGAVAALGLPLTMAAIAVVPILLGLTVDYAIQFQARAGEAGVAAASRRAAPAVATAALATAAGFTVLLASPVPMVRGFGALLVAGVAIGLTLALVAGKAALTLTERRSAATRDRDPGAPWPPPREAAVRVGSGMGRALLAPARAFGRSMRGAGEIVDAARGRVARPLARAADGVLGRTARHPGRVLAIGLLVALAGWAVESRTAVVSDLSKLVPQRLPAVRDLQTLQHDTGVAGEVDVLVQAPDLTQPKVVAWMRTYEAALLERYGYSAKHGCGRAALCPALSLPDLFRTPQSAATRRQIRALLDAVPPYFTRAAITPDRRTAVLAFGIRLDSLANQRKVFETMRAQLHPPPGVSARLAGLPVLAADANAALADPLRRALTTLASLLAVALVLALVHRRWRRTWLPLAPIALASGWSALVLWALGVPLNPLSAALGALVIAISTEFSVLLVARFHEEHADGHPTPAALARTYRSTGAAVLASGVTAIAGFAVLTTSDIAMLRDFGIVTVIDLTASLLGVLLVLPAVLTLADRSGARASRVRRRHVAA